MVKFMQVTPNAPMTGIEVTTRGRGMQYKNPSYLLQFTISVYKVHAFAMPCIKFYFLSLYFNNYSYSNIQSHSYTLVPSIKVTSYT